MEGPSVMRSSNGGLSFSFSSASSGVSGYGVKQGRLGRVDDFAEISIFDAKKYFNEVGNCDLQKTAIVDDGDSSVISVNLEKIPEHDGSVVQRFSSASSSVDGYSYNRNYKARSFHNATPTNSSEASWNSRTGLLSNPPGAISVSVLRHSDHHHQKTTRNSPAQARWIFRTPKCPCSGKKSVQVEECKPSMSKNTTPAKVSLERSSVKKPPIFAGECKTVMPKHELWGEERRCSDGRTEQISLPPPTENRFRKTNIITSSNRVGFTFPILNKATGIGETPSSPLTIRLNGGSVPVPSPTSEDPPRDLLEIFRHRKSNISNNRECPKSRIIAGANGDDDVASDASSDLFEIESFSTQTTSTYSMMFHRRDSLEELRRVGGGRSVDEPMTPSSIVPMDWYEPSEASIDWSVTTAEGFDRASMTNFSIAASEANDVLAMIRRAEQEKSYNAGAGRWVSTSGNGLLSCRSEKAVNFEPHPVKFVSSSGERHRAAAESSRPPVTVARSQS